MNKARLAISVRASEEVLNNKTLPGFTELFEQAHEKLAEVKSKAADKLAGRTETVDNARKEVPGHGLSSIIAEPARAGTPRKPTGKGKAKAKGVVAAAAGGAGPSGGGDGHIILSVGGSAIGDKCNTKLNLLYILWGFSQKVQLQGVAALVVSLFFIAQASLLFMYSFFLCPM